MTRKLRSELTLEKYRAQFHLGVGIKERSQTQWVSFSVTLCFGALISGLPEGASSDQVDDTVDYVEIAEILKKLSKHREYKIIEHLGLEAYKAVRQLVPQEVGISLIAIKERPPVDSLEGGARFSISDY